MRHFARHTADADLAQTPKPELGLADQLGLGPAAPMPAQTLHNSLPIAHVEIVDQRRGQVVDVLAMGVTTIITGNCGGSVRSIDGHLNKLAESGIGVNYGTLVGHGTVRSAVMGSVDRAPTREELAGMVALVAEAMKIAEEIAAVAELRRRLSISSSSSSSSSSSRRSVVPGGA